MITTSIPDSWKDLQDEVGKILSQCGFEVEIEKKVTTARGKAELDVFAEEIVKGRKYKIICECKYWKSKIPQSIIHGFRTILSDTGANKGYIISLEGFQSGSFKAVDFTNLELVTWEEFQNEFCDSWLENYFSPVITKKLDSILGYTEPLVQKWMCEVPDNEISLIKALREKYLAFSVVMMAFTTYSTFYRNKGFPELPLSQNDNYNQDMISSIPKPILEATGYREFLDESFKFGLQGINEFREIKLRNNV